MWCFDQSSGQYTEGFEHCCLESLLHWNYKSEIGETRGKKREVT